MLPYFVMQAVDHAPLSDPPKPLTDFLVHMIPIPEMLVVSASCCQFVEHVFRVTTAPVAVAQYGALGQIVMVFQIGIQEFQDMLPVESGNNAQFCQYPSLADSLHSGRHLETVHFNLVLWLSLDKVPAPGHGPEDKRASHPHAEPGDGRK